MLSGTLLSIGLAFVLIAIALGLLIFNDRRLQRRRLVAARHQALGLPEGKLVYEDADGQGEPLASATYPLTGKPAFVVQLSDGRPVPLLLQLTVNSLTKPASNHVVLIGAYCLILEDYFEIAPTYGLVRYADHEFQVDYTPALRRKVIRLLGEMEQSSAEQPPHLEKQKVTKCRACVFQPICPVGQKYRK